MTGPSSLFDSPYSALYPGPLQIQIVSLAMRSICACSLSSQLQAVDEKPTTLRCHHNLWADENAFTVLSLVNCFRSPRHSSTLTSTPSTSTLSPPSPFTQPLPVPELRASMRQPGAADFLFNYNSRAACGQAAAATPVESEDLTATTTAPRSVSSEGPRSLPRLRLPAEEAEMACHVGPSGAKTVVL